MSKLFKCEDCGEKFDANNGIITDEIAICGKCVTKMKKENDDQPIEEGDVDYPHMTKEQEEIEVNELKKITG